jgi:hypothetical protein
MQYTTSYSALCTVNYSTFLKSVAGTIELQCTQVIVIIPDSTSAQFNGRRDFTQHDFKKTLSTEGMWRCALYENGT